MNVEIITNFLRNIAANNNREWFQAHKNEYQTARAEFETNMQQAIHRIAAFDPSVANIAVKDTVYRFNRDTRFSPDKSPYKRHFGSFINAKGKKSLRGGYYIHIEPDNCMLAVGNYWLPTQILTACRNELMANADEWLQCVESRAFKHYFCGKNGGFGLEKLKTCPSGFPRDWEHVEYLRLKDYCAWVNVKDDFFAADDWIDQVVKIFKAGKPMMDFMNAVIDDYE